MELDLEKKQSRENRTSKLIYPNRNGTVWVLVVSTLILGSVHSGGGGGGGGGGKGGAGSESFHS